MYILLHRRLVLNQECSGEESAKQNVSVSALYANEVSIKRTAGVRIDYNNLVYSNNQTIFDFRLLYERKATIISPRIC